VGFALRLLERRNIEKPTDCRNTSSITGDAADSMLSRSMIVTLAGVSAIRVSVLVAVTVTSSLIESGVGVGC
jgi:hypothetical protein